MQLSISAALAAVLITGDVFVSAACPSRPAYSAVPFSFSWPAPSAYSPSTLSTVVVPAATTSSSSSSVAVVPTTTSSSSSVAVVPTTTSSSAAATSSAAASSSLTSDEQSALDTQNTARSDVGEAALAWDTGLVSDAQSWADQLATSGTPGTLTHATNTNEGENLYWQSNADSPFENAAAAWVAEKSSYSGEAIGTGSGFEEYGHYSMFFSFFPSLVPPVPLDLSRWAVSEMIARE